MWRNAILKRCVAAILLALAMPHADPGGLIHCVRADGSSSYEFACGCIEAPQSCECGECCCSDCPDQAQLVANDDCSGCSDFSLSISPAGAQPELPLMQLVALDSPQFVCVQASTLLAPAGLGRQVPRYCCGPPLAQIHTFSAVLRI